MSALKCGDDLLGYVTITGCDNFHILGRFLAGPDFRAYEPLLIRVYEASANDDPAWLDRLEEVNALGLYLDDSQRNKRRSIRDFKLEGVDGLKSEEGVRVEFKFDGGYY